MAGETQQSSVLWDQKAWEQMAYFAFRPENYFDQLCDVKPTRETHRGASVSFDKVNAMTAATTELTEVNDVTPVEVTDAEVNVVLKEYGNTTKHTKKLVGTSFLPVSETIATEVGFNMGESIDLVARTPFYAGTNVGYATGGSNDPDSRDDINADDKLTAHDIRVQVAKLRTDSVPTIGGSYIGVLHPHVQVDLMEDTDAAGWVTPANYSAAEKRWNGEIGRFEGVKFITAPRALTYADTGSPTTVDVYATVILGAQAIAKAHSKHPEFGPDPRMVLGPQTDSLKRFFYIGWYHLVGYGVFRQESLRRIESSSSLGT